MTRQPMSYAEASGEIEAMAKAIRALEEEHRKAGDDLAALEADYRRQLAEAFQRHRDDGKAQQEADVLAKADVITASWQRDRARNRLGNLVEQLEDRRGERASLHRLVDWSAARNGSGT